MIPKLYCLLKQLCNIHCHVIPLLEYGETKVCKYIITTSGHSLEYCAISSFYCSKNFMKKRLDNFKDVLQKCAYPGVPVMLLMDNINLYRGGKKRHQRLFKQVTPKMWNFTVRGAIIPNCDGIDQLFLDEETSQKPQRELSSVKANDMFIESNPDHLRVFEEAKDQYFVKLLHTGLNKVPPTTKDFSSMSEQEFNSWLKMYLQGLHEHSKNTYILHNSKEEKNKTQSATETVVLPISLENNATINGTASVLEHFGKDFQIPCNHSKVFMPYNEKLKTFDIESARGHHEFLYLLQEHKKEMSELEDQLTNMEKQLAEMEEEVLEESDNEDDCPDNRNRNSRTTSFQKIDGKFKKVFDKITNKMWSASQSIDPAASVHLIQYLKNNRGLCENAKDHHGCTILHHAVKNGNIPLVQTLINAGVNLNVKERCGATPLSLAVIKGDEKVVRLLLDNFAICDDDYYTEVPGPKHMADKMELHSISNLIESCTTKEKEQDEEVWEIMEVLTKEPSLIESLAEPNDDDILDVYSRSSKNCKTLVVGDQGTNKIIRSVKEKSSSAYGWAAEVPGDLHARGYLYEVCKKTMGPGGFMHVAQTVMKRDKVTDAAFGDKKFQHQNLNCIDEAVRDVSMAYGLAAVQKFKASELFPSEESLAEHKNAKGNHYDILLSAFKEWIKSQDKILQFRYHSQLFTLFGPMRELYLSSIKFGNGVAREAVWMMMLPLYCQLQKRNYWTEAFVHVMNFTAAWPIAIRKLLQNNCSVSVKGREGHNIALDEWVETYLVQPLKNYATGHSSVEILQLLSVNLEVIGAIRSAYEDREAFNVHATTRHCEQDPLPDQLKGMHFCLKEKFFDISNQDYVNRLSNQGERIGKVSPTLIDVYKKGKLKVTENYGRKLFNTFHILSDSKGEIVIEEDNEEADE